MDGITSLSHMGERAEFGSCWSGQTVPAYKKIRLRNC